MWQGTVEAIYITARAGAPMEARAEVQAWAGKGLEGDRNFDPGDGSANPKAGRNITLFEGETLEALRRDYGLELDASGTRRNVITRGVPLNHLVGREFMVGPVRVRGLKLAEPCSYLESLTVKGVLKALVHRGGLRAEILSDGVVRVGDAVCEEVKR